MKIDQQPNSTTTEFEVGEKLCLMDWVDLRDRLEFYNDRVFDKQIQSITDIDLETVVDYRQAHPRDETDASFDQFMNQARLIGALQQTGA